MESQPARVNKHWSTLKKCESWQCSQCAKPLARGIDALLTD